MKRSMLALLSVFTFTTAGLADNWPAWRGADGQGQSAEKGLPLTWSVKENVRWKAPLPDEGSSTPVIWGNRVFLTQASERTKPKGGGGPAVAKKRALMCFDRVRLLPNYAP